MHADVEVAEERDLLMIGPTEHDAAAYHLSGFAAGDAVVSVRVGGRSYLAVNAMEYGRAERESSVDELLSFDELEVMRLWRELGSGGRALAAATANLLQRVGSRSVTVPPTLGVLYADELRARGIEVRPDGRYFSELRRSKSEWEISAIERTQRQVEAACAHAVGILRAAEVADDGALVWDGDVLTSETLRSEIDVELLRRGCVAENTIAAGGAQSADPHVRGSGPLRAGEPIILDIFPVDAETRYYADMTRTFVKGDPSPELERMYEVVLRSQEAALEAIRAGVDGREVHEKVSDVIHEAGYKTLVHDQVPGEPLRVGFMHGTGHGVGLEIHEGPRISLTSETLEPGDVVTVEPGVYDPAVGGVRIEDLVVVTEDGCRNLTEFPKGFRL